MKRYVVTGVSTGIGHAIARQLVAEGHRVFGSVRRPEDAARLAVELGQAFTPLQFDVADEEAVRAAAATVRAALGGARLDGLVNNAGIVVSGPLLDVKPERLATQFDVNVVGPLRVIHAFAPLLGTDSSLEGAPGRIVNIGSVVGRLAPPFMGAYAASKHALEAVTDALRRELLLFGVDVILVGPGPVDTPIFDKREARAPSVFDAALERYDAVTAQQRGASLRVEQVSAVVVSALTARRPKARYAISSSGLQGFLLWRLMHLFPKRLVDRLFGRMLGLRPGAAHAVASRSSASIA